VIDALGRIAPQVPALKVIMFEWFDRPMPFARDYLMGRIRDQRLTFVVDLRKPVQMDGMPAILRTCTIGMIAHGRKLAEGTQPNRVYEYMACGLPILAPSYDKGIAPLIESEQCGLLVDFEDPAAIADALLRLQRNPEMCREMGRNGREAFLARHNWEVEVRPLMDRIKSWFPDRISASETE
jgi:glycosyltransferase involved in cell wall biosynthesis